MCNQASGFSVKTKKRSSSRGSIASFTSDHRSRPFPQPGRVIAMRRSSGKGNAFTNTTTRFTLETIKSRSDGSFQSCFVGSVMMPASTSRKGVFPCSFTQAPRTLGSHGWTCIAFFATPAPIIRFPLRPTIPLVVTTRRSAGKSTGQLLVLAYSLLLLIRHCAMQPLYTFQQMPLRESVASSC